MYGTKPVIGVCPLFDEKRDSYWMLPGYMQMLEAAGAVPMMLPLTVEPDVLDYFLETCDGFILTGGQDVSPAFYGQERTELCGVSIPERDEMDAYILNEAILRDKAVLGICRGHQLMNAALGGTLYQDVAAQHDAPISHRMAKPYDGVAHEVRLIPGSPPGGTAGAGICWRQQLPPPGHPGGCPLSGSPGGSPGRHRRGGVSARQKIHLGRPVAPGIRLEN